jgi:hypothetical protein
MWYRAWWWVDVVGCWFWTDRAVASVPRTLKKPNGWCASGEGRGEQTTPANRACPSVRMVTGSEWSRVIWVGPLPHSLFVALWMPLLGKRLPQYIVRKPAICLPGLQLPELMRLSCSCDCYA